MPSFYTWCIEGMLVHLIRHAETAANVAGNILGGVGTPLTAKGLEQARQLSRYLKNANLGLFYASPYERAQHTARIISAEDAISDARLQEIGRGDWDGLPLTLIDENMRAWRNTEPLDFKTPGGESLREVSSRMRQWLTDAYREARKGGYTRITAVSHGHAIRSLLWRLFGFDGDKLWQMTIYNTSITTIRLVEDIWRLEGVNCLPHMSENLFVG